MDWAMSGGASASRAIEQPQRATRQGVALVEGPLQQRGRAALIIEKEFWYFTRMRTHARHWLLMLSGLLAACAMTSTTSAEVPPDTRAERVDSWEAGCDDERTLVLLCREDAEECGLFVCRDTVPREVLLAFRGGGGLPVAASPASPRRRWGADVPWPRDTQPVLTFHFNRQVDPKRPVFLLPPGRYVRHHLFPQAPDLARWFARQGIPDIHRFTMVIPAYIHRQIHSQGPSGGLWNEAWRHFRTEHPNASPQEIYQHAGELIFRFELTGPIVPYGRTKWDR